MTGGFTPRYSVLSHDKGRSNAVRPGEVRPFSDRDPVVTLYGLPSARDEQSDNTWRAEGLCLGLWERDPELAACFFSDAVALQRRAKALCAQCSVSEECGEYGLREPTGIWGGLGVRERQRALARVRVHSRPTA